MQQKRAFSSDPGGKIRRIDQIVRISKTRARQKQNFVGILEIDSIDCGFQKILLKDVEARNVMWLVDRGPLFRNTA